MTFPDHIFRAYDIRGVVESALTPSLTRRIGGALAAEAVARGVGEFVVGRDGRLSGPRIADALIGGLLAGGCDVIDIGMVPTPTLYFACHRIAADGSGVQVTASHNPPQYNGLKMMLDGSTLADEAIQEIKQRVIAGESSAAASARPGTLRHADALAAYRQEIVADIRLAKPLKVVIDCGNGVAGVVAPEVFAAIGCDVVELYCEVDGTFPNHHPDPSCAENLADLRAAVRRHRADFGLAFDGDGDRLGVVCAGGGGDIIWPDRQMLLFAESILRAHPGAEIVFDVKCTRLLPQAIEARGGIATLCKTGHSFIKNKLRETGAAFAGEMSGHLFFNDRWGGFDDAVYAGARLCELLAADDRPPAEVFAALPDTCNTPELQLEMAEGEPQELVAELLAIIETEAHFDDGVVNTLDGIRVDFDHGFGLIRASNTTPALIMRFEADDRRQLQELQARFRRLLLAVRGDLRLPF